MENGETLLSIDEYVWKIVFSSEIELGSNIAYYFEDFQTYVERNLTNFCKDEKFKLFMEHTITSLHNYSPSNEKNQTTLEYLPKYFVFLTRQFINYSDNLEITSIIEPLFSPFTLTFASFPDIYSEISYILFESMKRKESNTIAMQVVKLLFTLENPLIILKEYKKIFNNVINEKAEEAYANMQSSLLVLRNRKISKYWDILLSDAFYINSSLTIYGALNMLFAETEKHIASEGTSIDEYIKFYIGYPVIIRITTEGNTIVEESIGSVAVSAGNSIESSINDLIINNGNVTVEAGDDICITFNEVDEIQESFALNGKLYKIKSFICKEDKSYDVYSAKYLLMKDESFLKNVVFALYSVNSG
jgi:hypothetical protein